MKRIFTLLVVSIIASSAVFAQSTELKISEKVKVTFPGKPEEKQGPNGAVVHFYATKDSSTAYMVVNVDLSQMGLTAEMITAYGDALWEQMKGSMIAQIPGAVLTKDQISTFKGKSSLYTEIDGTNSTAPLMKQKKAFGYSFFVGAVLHQVTYYSSSPTAKADDAASFFNSVVIAD